MAEIEIEQLVAATPEAVDELNGLVEQLTKNAEVPLDMVRLERILMATGALYVARSEGKIVGTVYRVDMHHPVRSKSWIEDLVVDKDHRGKGIARRLMETAIAEVPAEMVSISLNSNVARVESHQLYQKLGFEVLDETRIWLRRLPRD
jgi:GNAT superfamily N-acetyltransferase